METLPDELVERIADCLSDLKDLLAFSLVSLYHPIGPNMVMRYSLMMRVFVSISGNVGLSTMLCDISMCQIQV